jgi:hypothetical protein
VKNTKEFELKPFTSVRWSRRKHPLAKVEGVLGRFIVTSACRTIVYSATLVAKCCTVFQLEGARDWSGNERSAAAA